MNTLPCGCYWTRERDEYGTGDVLHQCGEHKAGASYGPASEPSKEATDRLMKAFADAGFHMVLREK